MRAVTNLRRLTLVASLVAAWIPSLATADDKAHITIKLTGTRFDCKKPTLATEPGFERCELYTIPRFTAPKSALLEVFGHCDATIRFRTRDSLLDDSQSFFERFNAAIVDGSGLAPVTIVLKPTRFLSGLIVEAKVTELQCMIDQVFDKAP